MELKSDYWDHQYQNGRTGWDIGYAAPAIVEYFQQKNNKELKILIPGAGNAWEAEYLWKTGFKNLFVLDFSQQAVDSFQRRFPDFPSSHIFKENYFHHHGQYDIIVEQTFFSSLSPHLRVQYAEKAYHLLKPKGKLVGLLFNHPFNFEGPPYGGSPEEYKRILEKHFFLKTFRNAYNSIKPRKGRELFIIAERKIDESI
jgi:SAM-dependent methyltransferase